MKATRTKTMRKRREMDEDEVWNLESGDHESKAIV